MGQADIRGLLKQNPQSFLSAKEIAKLANISIQTATKCLNKLMKDADIENKIVIGQSNIATKLYRFKITNDYFVQALHEYKIMQSDPSLQNMGGETIRQLMMIAELKKLNEVKQ
jgi:hypothetical protein